MWCAALNLAEVLAYRALTDEALGGVKVAVV